MKDKELKEEETSPLKDKELKVEETCVRGSLSHTRWRYQIHLDTSISQV